MICLKEKQNMTDEQIKNQRLEEKNKHKIRAKVEHRFAHMKYHTTRYIGLVRNNMNFTITCLASNLKLLAHQQMKRIKVQNS
tara:strand:+ start:1520 stop:1765 length:246 start_codon:yes stop_codon:yes gene_type:complete